jgi:hypothetical protein
LLSARERERETEPTRGGGLCPDLAKPVVGQGSMKRRKIRSLVVRVEPAAAVTSGWDRVVGFKSG